jgi:hypothetical protein
VTALPRNVCGSTIASPHVMREIDKSLAAQVAKVREQLNSPDGRKSLHGRTDGARSVPVRSLEP